MLNALLRLARSHTALSNKMGTTGLLNAAPNFMNCVGEVCTNFSFRDFLDDVGDLPPLRLLPVMLGCREA